VATKDDVTASHLFTASLGARARRGRKADRRNAFVRFTAAKHGRPLFGTLVMLAESQPWLPAHTLTSCGRLSVFSQVRDLARQHAAGGTHHLRCGVCMLALTPLVPNNRRDNVTTGPALADHGPVNRRHRGNRTALLPISNMPR
jgi:hypothetical protein